MNRLEMNRLEMSKISFLSSGYYAVTLTSGGHKTEEIKDSYNVDVEVLVEPDRQASIQDVEVAALKKAHELVNGVLAIS